MTAKKGEHRSRKTEFLPGGHPSSKTEFKKGLIPWNKGLRYSHRNWERVEYKVPELLKWQWAYIAGFFDGEGWIIHTKRIPSSDYQTVTLGMGQKEKWVLEIIQKWLNLTKGLTSNIQRNGGRYSGNRQYSLRITAQNQVLKILKMLQPFLIVKQEKAQEAIIYLESKRRYVSKRRRVLIRG